MDQSLQFEQQLFIPDIKSIDINHIRGPFFTDYQSLSPCGTLALHLTLYNKMKIKPHNVFKKKITTKKCLNTLVTHLTIKTNVQKELK